MATTTLNATIKEVKGKIPSITNVDITAALNARINEVNGKIPYINNLLTTTAFTAVWNKISNVSNLVKKSDYNTNISEIENEITTDRDHDKYITTQEFNKLTAEKLTVRLAQANLSSRNYIANFVKKKDFDNKLTNFNRNKWNELSKKLKQYQQKD